ncbi:MAG: hypothetical protein R3320_10875, partial [Nitriliruptorales bacterium]|nr:hypothetical protein [Nitriliruptorales bacterium]
MSLLERIRGERTAIAAVARIHQRLDKLGHPIPVRLWNGAEFGPEDRGYRLLLNHPWSLRAMLTPPTDLNVGECYVTGVFD